MSDKALFDPDGSHVVLSSGGSLSLWNLSSKKEESRFDLGETITDFDLEPDGTRVLLALADNTVLLFDVAGGEIVEHIGEGSAPVRLGPEAKVAVFTQGTCDAQGGCISAPVLTQVTSGASMHQLRTSYSATDLAFSPGGELVIAGLSSGGIRIWDSRSGAVLDDYYWFEARQDIPETDAQHIRDDILFEGLTSTSVDISVDGSTLVSGIKAGFPTALLALQDSGVVLWDISLGTAIQRLAGHDFETGVHSVAFDPSGRRALSGGAGELILWDIESGQELMRLRGHSGDIRDVSFSPDGRYALSAATDGTVRLWDLSSELQLVRLEIGYFGTGSLIQALDISPDGNFALVGGIATARSDPGTKLIDLNTGEVVREYERRGVVHQLVFAPDGARALEVSGGGHLNLLNVSTGETIHSFGEVGSVGLNPDGDSAFSGGILWDLSTGDIKREMDHGAWGLFTPDGQFVVSLLSSRTIVVSDPATGREVRRFSSTEDLDKIVDVSPDSQSVLAVSGESLSLVDIFTGREISRFVGHNGWILSADISLDGRVVLSGSEDGSVRWWSADTGEELRREWHNAPVHGVRLSRDGEKAVSASFDGVLVVWRSMPPSDQLLSWVKANRYIRDITCFERQTYGVAPLCESSK